MQEEILKQALANAIKFNGKANPGVIIGKIINQFKDKDPKELAIEVNNVIKEVNSMSLDDQTAKLKDLGGVKEVKKEKREGLKELPYAEKGKVVMRFAPSPSGPMHVGHALGISLNSEYVRMYDGKLILRIEDTNPDNIYTKAYDMIKEEADWITKNNVSEVLIQSDRIDIYYSYALRLIEMGGMYICDCDPEKTRSLLNQKKACPCRELPNDAHVKRWHDMFTKYKQGDAVARVKTDIKNKNPAMRDFPAFRINESEHPRQGKKYIVWPLMNFSVFVDDIESGMTHIIRGKEHADNAKRQSYLYKYFKKPEPVTLFIGKINFTDLKVKCSTTRPLIENKTYTGWDDPRLAFLAALKKRGYQPETFIKYALSLGVSLTDKTVNGAEFFKTINAFNKELIDPISNRYFFIESPKKITIEKAPEQDVELDLHPGIKNGGRKFKTKDSFYITNEDFKSFKDKDLIRLMDCLNFTKKGKKLVFKSLDYEEFKNSGKTIIHWLPEDKKLVNVEIIMPDNSTITGLGESSIESLKPDQIIQFERFGFCRLDSNDDIFKFYFCHK